MMDTLEDDSCSSPLKENNFNSRNRKQNKRRDFALSSSQSSFLAVERSCKRTKTEPHRIQELHTERFVQSFMKKNVIQVKVRSLTGTIHVLSCDTFDTIRNVKKKLRPLLGVEHYQVQVKNKREI